MSGRHPVLAFGEMLLRLKSPGRSRLLQEPSLEAHFGGAELNVLASLAQLGIDSEMVTMLPDNAVGSAAIEELRRYGIGVQHVQRCDARMGLYFLEAGASIRPGRVLYDRADSAFARHQHGHFDWPAILEGARWLHLTGITAAVGQEPSRSLLAAAQAAHRLGVPISFDINMRHSLWKDSGRSPRQAHAEILELATIIFAGPGDWSVCLDTPPLPGNDLPSLAVFHERMLAAHPGAHAVISSVRDARSADDHDLTAVAGVRGVGQVRSRTVSIRNVVDRVGAGDAMVAGCLAGRLEEAPWRDLLDLGVMAGALKHTVPGDVNRISREELHAALAATRAGHLLR